jgi:hypothetical protein
MSWFLLTGKPVIGTHGSKRFRVRALRFMTAHRPPARRHVFRPAFTSFVGGVILEPVEPVAVSRVDVVIELTRMSTMENFSINTSFPCFFVKYSNRTGNSVLLEKKTRKRAPGRSPLSSTKASTRTTGALSNFTLSTSCSLAFGSVTWALTNAPKESIIDLTCREPIGIHLHDKSLASPTVRGIGRDPWVHQDLRVAFPFSSVNSYSLPANSWG